MKITITAAGTTPFVLGDDSVATTPIAGTTIASFQNGLGGGIKDGFTPDSSDLDWISPLFRASDQFGAPRYNQVTRYSFTVERFFLTAQNCGLFIDIHAGQIPRTGFWTTIHQTSSGAIIIYRPIAIYKSAKPVLHQQEFCKFSYQFTLLGAPTLTQPI